MTLSPDMIRFAVRCYQQHLAGFKRESFVEYDERYNVKYILIVDGQGICTPWSLYEYGYKVISFDLKTLEIMNAYEKL